MIVYLLVIEDHHTDIEIEVWTNKEKAIQKAREYLNDCENVEEQETEGLIFDASYGEGDFVSVREEEVME